MFKYFFYYYKKRIFWFFLFLSALFLNLFFLYLQYIMLLKPCFLCIYQRCALSGLILSGLIGYITKHKLFIFISNIIFIYSSFKGLLISIKQNKIYLLKDYVLKCDIFIFPYWFPLDKWLPSIFKATGYCYNNNNKFLFLLMSKWMILLFSIYFFIALIIFINKFIFVLFNRKK